MLHKGQLKRADSLESLWVSAAWVKFSFCPLFSSAYLLNKLFQSMDAWEPPSHIFQLLHVPVYTFFPGSQELYSTWPNLSKGSPARLIIFKRVLEIVLILHQLLYKGKFHQAFNIWNSIHVLFKYWSTSSQPRTPIILSLQTVLSHFSLEFDSLPYYPVSASGSNVLSCHGWTDFIIVLLAAQNAPGPDTFFLSDFSSE